MTLAEHQRHGRPYATKPIHHFHKYLTGDPSEVDEGAPNYHEEEGILVDDTEKYKPNTREGNEAQRAPFPASKIDLLAEEAAWAAKSGPVYIKHKEPQT